MGALELAQRRRPRPSTSSSSASSSAPAWNFVRAAARARSRAALGIGRQRRGAFEEGRGGGEAATRLRSSRGTLELRGDVLIGSGFGLRAVPGAAIGIDLGIGRLRERAVDLAPLLQPGGAVDGRANEGVTEHHAGSRASAGPPLRRSSAAVSGIPSRSAARQTSAGSPTGSAAATSSRRRASCGSLASRRVKLSSMLADSGTAAGRPKPARELRRRQPARQLEQRERIPARLDDDPLQHALVQPGRQDGLQQRPRVAMPQRLDVELRQARQRVAERRASRTRARSSPPAGGEPRTRARAPTHRSSHCASSTTQSERPLLGGLGQQAEDRQSDEERIRRPARR